MNDHKLDGSELLDKQQTKVFNSIENGDNILETGPDLVAYVVMKPGKAVTAQELREYLRRILPEPMVPRSLVVVESLPRTASGKIDKLALPVISSPSTTDGRKRTPTEEMVGKIWDELLQQSSIALDANFFDVGGHSLRAMQLVARLRAAFQLNLPLRVIFESATIEDLSLRIDELKSELQTQSSFLPRVAVPPCITPASSTQRRFWFQEQLEPSQPHHHIPTVIRLKGFLDEETLEESFRQAIARHDPLRTSFEVVDGEPVQRIACDVKFELSNLAIPLEASDTFIDSVIKDLLQKPFSLDEPPLVRANLIKRADDCHILVIVIHHIIADGWSVNILLHDLIAYYRALCTGEDASLTPLPFQYADYALAKNTETDGSEAGLAYWQRQLADAPLMIEMPVDYPRPSVRSRRGRQLAFHIPADVMARISQTARQHDATSFIVLLSAYATLLSRYTGQDTIVIGSPVACRERVELEWLIGPFANMIALRVDLRGNPTFSTLLNQVRQTALDAYAHQSVPFESIVESVNPERDMRRSPIFQATLTLQNIPAFEPYLPGLWIEPLHVDAGIAPFELSLFFNEVADGLDGLCVCNRDLYLPGTILEFVRQFQELLQSAFANLDRPIKKLSLSNGQERLNFLQRGACRDSSTDASCLPELFERQVTRTPNRKAISFNSSTLSYDDLNRQANRLARYLRSLGIGPDSLVGICLERSPDLVVALLAVLKAGGAYVPIDPSYPHERQAFMVQDSGASVLITRGAGATAATESHFLVDIDDARIQAESDTNLEVTIQPQNLAYVIYTSGSTGWPKAVGVEHRNVTRLFAMTERWFGFKEEDVWCLFHSVAFDFSVWELWGALLYGGRLVIVPQSLFRSPKAFHDLIRREGITILNQTPSAFLQLIQADDWLDPLNSLRTIVFGGEALIPETLGSWIKRYGDSPDLVNMYGITETTVHVTIRRVTGSDVERKSGSFIGEPIDDQSMYILDEDLEPVPIGVPGEIYVGGAGVSRGYIRDAALTASRFLPDPFTTQAGARLYRTGDRARCRADGEIEFLGRVDDQFKIRGFRIEPAEVEMAVATHPQISQSIVALHTDGSMDQQLVCYYVPRKETTLSAIALREYLRTKVPQYLVPTIFVAMETLPLTPEGKVARRALPSPDVMRTFADREYVEPANETERQLAKIWCNLVRVDRIGRHDNFFDLGGHSLLAMKMVGRVREKFGIDLHVAAIFDEQTLLQVAAVIDRCCAAEAGTISSARRTKVLHGLALERLPTNEYYELSPYQLPEWYFYELEPDDPVYNVSNSDVLLTGEIDLQVFVQAWQALFDRHAVFRTSFDYKEGRPVQKIISRVELRTEDIYLDFRNTPEDQVDIEMRTLINTYACDTFDLTRAPILTLKLAEFPGKRFLLIFVTHHILWDEISTLVCARDLAEFYNAFRSKRPPNLPPLEIDYVDFAAWANRAVTKGHLEGQRHYWLRQFADLPPALDLPGDFPRPAVQTYKGATVSEYIPRELCEQLWGFLKESNVTLYIFLLAVLNTQLHRLSGQCDFVVGTPIANRDDERLDDVLGLFATALPMRCRIEEKITFRDLLRHTRQTAVEAFDNHAYPSILAIQELNPATDFSRTRLFSVMYGVQNDKTELMHNLNFEGLRLTLLPAVPTPEFDRAKFDISLVVDQFENNIVLQWTHNTDIFKTSTALMMLKQFLRLLDQVVANPDRPLTDYEMMDPEQEKLLLSGNATLVESNNSPFVHRRFEALEKRVPEAAALLSETCTISYRELNLAANRVAWRLLADGIGIEDRVGIILDTSISFVVAMLGVLKAGAAFVPISPGYPLARQQEILRQACVRIVLDDDWMQLVSQTNERLANPTHELHEQQLAYVIFTSGTTGTPKGIEIEHPGLGNLISSTQRDYSLGPSDRVLFSTAPVFDAFLLETLWPLSVGAAVVVNEPDNRRDISAMVRIAAAKSVTVIQAVPQVLDAIAEIYASSAGAPMERLRLLISGGAVLTRETCNRIRERFSCQLVNHYGPTEVTVDATRFDCSEDIGSNFVSIGTPIANAHLYVLGPNLRPVPHNVRGEIFVGSPGIARGYTDDPIETALRFIPDPFTSSPGKRLFRTGDLGTIRQDFTTDWLGRVDKQVKVLGNRVELEDIDAHLTKHPAVWRSVTINTRDDAGGEGLVSYVELWPRSNELRNGEKVFRLFTLAQRPELQSVMDCIHASAWPPFLAYDEAVMQLWPRLASEFPQLQFALIDERGSVVAVGNAVPTVWDGTCGSLPSGWSEALTEAFKSSVDKKLPDTLLMLAAVVAPDARGKGLSTPILQAFKALSRAHDLCRIIVPVRPTGKARWPDLNFVEYCSLRRDDNLAMDSWLRAHEQVGGQVLRIDVNSQCIRGTVGEWEIWAGRTFKRTGNYTVKGALQPVWIDCEHDEGVYYDPCIWVQHEPSFGKTCQWQAVDARTIRDFLVGTLPSYMVPNSIVFVTQMPINPSGKVDEDQLPRPLFGQSRHSPFTAPETILEERICDIWQQVLGHEQISVLDDFYEIGGHSLRAVQMLRTINEGLNVRLKLQDIFRHRTVRQLAKFINNQTGPVQ